MAILQLRFKSSHLTTIMLLFPTIILTSCYNSNTTERMKKDEFTQISDTFRTLTVVALEQTESKVYVTFFETPQVFELSLEDAQGELNYKMLTEAKEKQLPVNVFTIIKQDKNAINRIQSLTETQMNQYLKKRDERQTATPVTKPN